MQDCPIRSKAGRRNTKPTAASEEGEITTDQGEYLCLPQDNKHLYNYDVGRTDLAAYISTVQYAMSQTPAGYAMSLLHGIPDCLNLKT